MPITHGQLRGEKEVCFAGREFTNFFVENSLDAEDKIHNENKKIIEIFEKKISYTISALWS